ncbi:MAG TPA: ComEC/Rec2 family competence protein [Candidatus Limnocylindria bacterium]|nr:ComEC/Rec2 family competence protein [Candidatus Limnocylindria bacterium]
MKLPALWIVAAFATGIELATRWPASPKLWAAAATVAIVAGAVITWRNHKATAWTVALLAWLAIGGFAATVESAAVPANHVTRLIATGRIDTSEPLRWRGRLREDPLLMPWGRRYEITLEEVDLAGVPTPINGGLRANLYSRPADAGDENDSPQGLRAGDRVEALVRARAPRNFLDLGAFDLRGYLARQKIDLIGSLRSGELLRLVDRPAPTILQRLARGRGNLLARLDQLFAGQPQRLAVLRAMLLGDRTFIESEVVTTFQKTGAYHVLVVAGLHVGALAVFFYWVGRRLKFSVGLVSLLTILTLLAYVGMVQDRPPILRAGLMVALYLCARPLFRRVELLNTIAIAALAILAWRPSSLADSSFQLSFLAAAVIAGLALPWLDRSSEPYRAGLAHLGDVTRDIAHPPKIIQFRIEMRMAVQWFAAHMPAWIAKRADLLLTFPIRTGLRLWEVALLSAVIQWGMMPLMAQDFHRVTLAGPLSNIPAVLLTGLIVPLGFLALVLTFVWAQLAWALANVLGFCAGLLLVTVNWFSHWPRMSYRIPGPPIWLAILFFAAFTFVAAIARAAAARRQNRIARRAPPPPIHLVEWISALALVALTILVATHPFAPALEKGKLEVSVLDVGQGDSIFVGFPDGHTLLIDGGGQPGSNWIEGRRPGMDIGEEIVSPYLWSRGLKKIDVVALTHAHHDHIDGLRSVLQNFRVRELWIGRDEQTSAMANLLEEARALGIPIIHEKRGDHFEWGGVEGNILWPADSSPAPAASNDDSIVVRLTDGGVHLLLTGDIEKHVESRLVEEHAPLAAEFLKVPHHGGKNSSTEPFLAAVAPRIAVVSVGEANQFGHPADVVLDRYGQAGVRLLRTDHDGAVTAIADGQNLEVRTFAELYPQ